MLEEQQESERRLWERATKSSSQLARKASKQTSRRTPSPAHITTRLSSTPPPPYDPIFSRTNELPTADPRTRSSEPFDPRSSFVGPPSQGPDVPRMISQR